MKNPLQITFRHMDSSPAVEARIRAEVDELEQHFGRITSCRVVVEEPHRRQRGNEYHIAIDLHVPGSQIVVNHVPTSHAIAGGGRELDEEPEKEALRKDGDEQPEHKDVYVSIRDAFAAARRQLDDYAEKLRGETKQRNKQEVY
ncbi:MAG: HPF/RaiA family ribosome-associated protein [Prosthecobacter sp.]